MASRLRGNQIRAAVARPVSVLSAADGASQRHQPYVGTFGWCRSARPRSRAMTAGSFVVRADPEGNEFCLGWSRRNDRRAADPKVGRRAGGSCRTNCVPICQSRVAKLARYGPSRPSRVIPRQAATKRVRRCWHRSPPIR